MVATPPFALVLDISALSAALPREWIEFSRVGSCYVPHVVYEEMKFLFDRTPDPDLERIARAFNRFYATSGWQITDAASHHSSLKVPSGQAMTKRSRISLAVGKCALGLAQQLPGSLVVLVTSDRALIQRLYEIPTPNLCGITGAALLQWSRTGQRPIAVSQKLQQFRGSAGNTGITSLPSGTTGINTGIKSGTTGLNSASQSRINSPSRVTSPKPKPVVRPAPPAADWLPQTISLLSSVAALAVAAFIVWAVFNNEGFQQLLKPLADTTEQRSP